MKTHWRDSTKLGLLAAGTLFTLVGCAHHEAVYVQPEPVPGPVVVVDDFYYYPEFGIYFGARSHNWYYHDGGRWIRAARPPGYRLSEVHRSPSVHMEFHDGPERHHADVIRQYPRNWHPGSTGGPGRYQHGRDHH